MKKVRKLIELEIVKFKNIPDGGWNYYSRIFSKYEFISILVSKNFIIKLQKRFSCYPFSIVNNNCDLNNIFIPDGCKWRLDPNLESATSFMFTFIYTTIEWLVEVKAYS